MKNGELNKEQIEAVNYVDGPLLVLAGAGSGKTKVLVHRVVKLIKVDGVKPEKIALLTFTNKAAEEMKKRIKTLVGTETTLGFVGTFHSFCLKLLREFGEEIGIARNFVIFDTDDSESAMKDVLKEMKIDPSEAKPGMFLSIIGKMKNDLVDIDTMRSQKQNYFYDQVAKVWSLYQAKLTKNRAVDFDDLLEKSVRLLRLERVRKEINERLEWILVDEYQDTNQAQFQLTKLLSLKYRNLTVVGDASQAIYSFRGADFRNILLLQNEYSDIKQVDLPRNYRSTQTILDSAYSVVSNNTSHPTIKLVSDREEGEKVKLLETADEKTEARTIVSEAVKLANSKEDVAILYRVNSQSRAIEEELVRRAIPYRLVGGTRFYNRAEIKDLLAYMRLIINSEEEISRKRVEKIGKRKAALFFNWLESKPLSLVEDNPGQTLNEVLNVTNYLDKYDERDEEDASRIENINELLAVASQFGDVGSFLESAALAESESRSKVENSKITLMTVHAAKGLEFESVFVVGMEEGLFPHSRSITLGAKEEIEEERRLMYVAMTRAKKKLFLSFARSRLVFGGRVRSMPSRFLSEIKPMLLERALRESEDFTVKKAENSGRRIVQDWEVERETKDDFADIDNW